MAKIRMQKMKAHRMKESALERVRILIDRYGARLAGDESTKSAACDLKAAFEESCDSSGSESFPVHPGAFFGWIRILVLIYPVALVLLFLSQPLIALLILCGGVYIMVRQFFLYHELIDRFYPEKEGINVWGVIEPQSEVKRTVIYSGHHDSAPVFNFFTDKAHLYIVKVGGALGSFALLTLFSLIDTLRQIIDVSLFSVTAPPLFLLIFYVLLAAAFPLVFKLWSFVSKEGSPGAGDNLISSSIGVELSRYFRNEKDSGSALAHTRLIFASFDAEESGLRGSRHFFSRHVNDLVQGAGYHFNVECLYDHTHLSFLTSDVNGSVPLSQEMAVRCVETALSMGYQARSQKIAFLTGGTDAAEAARAGLEATTLIGMPWGNTERGSVYHTPSDTVDQVDEVAVEQAISIAIRFIENLDRM